MGTEKLSETVLGYHGTSVAAAKSILEEGFQISRNPYDWLGDGVYFFQEAPQRAWEWACGHHGETASVLAAKIHIVNCMDLLAGGWESVIADAYNSYLQKIKESRKTLPEQAGGAHRLDREVINYTVGVLNDSGTKIACVRAAFVEGRAVFPNSALFDQTHVQIAVRDSAACVLETWQVPAPSPRGEYGQPS